MRHTPRAPHTPRARHLALAAIPALIAPLLAAQPALAQTSVATFDSLPEGHWAFQIEDGGITFRDLDQRIPGSPPPGTLNIDNAAPDLSGAGFTEPNALTFGGYAPGPGVGFGRIGSLTIIPPGLGQSASVEVFDFANDPANSMNLVAYLLGQEVARTTVPIQGGFTIHHTHLEVNAQFDELRLVGAGPVDGGVFFAAIDTVRITGLTEPCYANCDGSSTQPILNVNDFICFQGLYAAQDPRANCDDSSTPPVLNVVDFVCFQTKYAQGCD